MISLSSEALIVWECFRM